jgi:hypothetical protein
MAPAVLRALDLERYKLLRNSRDGAKPRRVPERVSTGIAQLDSLCAGFPRGAITELWGAPSSGLTTLVCASFAAAAEREEVFALIDVADAFDPATAHAAGVDLERLLWVRCRSSLERAFKSADLLLEAGGFGLVVLDLLRAPASYLRKVPPAFWFRFRRSIAPTPTALLALVPTSCAGSTAALVLSLAAGGARWRGNLLRGLSYEVEQVRPPASSRRSCRIEADIAVQR